MTDIGRQSLIQHTLVRGTNFKSLHHLLLLPPRIKCPYCLPLLSGGQAGHLIKAWFFKKAYLTIIVPMFRECSDLQSSGIYCCR